MKLKIKCAGIVNKLNSRDDLQYISDSQEVKEIKAMLGYSNTIKLNDFDSFFVKVDNGDYEEIYGLSGIVPYFYKPIFKIDATY
jgi:hypothetical protein